MGGGVSLNTANGDLVLQRVDSFARSLGGGLVGNGGNITLNTNNGHIQVTGTPPPFVSPVLNAYASTFGAGGSAGNVTLTATQGITLAASLQTYGLGMDTNGGDVTLTANEGNVVTAEIMAHAETSNTQVGDGGNVSLQAPNGGVTSGSLNTYSRSPSLNTPSGNAGNLTVLAGNGDVVSGDLGAHSESRGEFGDTGDAGLVTVTASNGNIFIDGDIRADAFSLDNNTNSGDVGNGQAITLQATQNITITGGVQSFARSSTFFGLPTPTGTAGNAGPVTLSATNINLSYIDARTIAAGTIGAGGTVQITAGQFFSATGVIFGSNETISTVGQPNTGPITITHGGNGITPFIIGDPATNGVTQTLTTGDASVVPNQSFLYSHFEAPNLWIISVPRPALVINELMQAPDAVTDDVGEWIELYNPHEVAVDIAGCRLIDDGTDNFFIESVGPLLVQPKSYFVMGKNIDPAQNGGVTVDYEYGEFGHFLNDVADEVVLECDGFEKDRVNYDDATGFPDVTGGSIQLLSPELENNAGGNWCAAVSPWLGSAGDRGTPGTANTCPTDFTLSKTVSPTEVGPGQNVIFTLVYTNNGPGLADTVITDIIPSALTGLSVTSSGPAIVPVPGTNLAWQVSEVPPGTTGIITISGFIHPAISNTTIVNTAQIATEGDLDDLNNADDASVTVLAKVPIVATVYLPVLFKGAVETLPPPDLIVDHLVATSAAITVVVKNVGGSDVVDAFWVDAYIDPTTAPTGVNQAWYDLGAQGVVWGVTAPALPLAPAQSLTLTLTSPYYNGTFSGFTPPLPPGTPVYAQVDSVNLLTTYGGVLEDHEIVGGVYNNITQTLSVAGVMTPPARTVPLFLPSGNEGLPERQ